MTSLRKASRRLSHVYDIALMPSGLKGTQFSLLSELSRRKDAPPTMSELAVAMTMDRSTLGQNILPLERDRLVRVVPNPADKRSRMVTLTDAGFKKLEEARPLWESAQSRFEAILGDDAVQKLRGILQIISSDKRFDVI